MIDQLGDSEVQQLDVALARGNYVAGLDVAMQHAPSVGSRQGAGDSHPDGQGLAPRQRALQPREALPVDVFGHEVGHPLCFSNAVDGHDVGVLQACDGPGFHEEAFAGFRVGVGGGDELDGDRAVEEQVACEVDLSHPAASDQSLDAVAIEVFRWRPVLHAGESCNLCAT